MNENRLAEIEEFANIVDNKHVTVDRNELLELIKALRDERANVEWIRVDDRLPNNQTETIIFGDGQVLTGFVYYEQDGVFMDCMDTVFDVNEVTRWMPLPKPPKNI